MTKAICKGVTTAVGGWLLPVGYETKVGKMVGALMIMRMTATQNLLLQQEPFSLVLYRAHWRCLEGFIRPDGVCKQCADTDREDSWIKACGHQTTWS